MAYDLIIRGGMIVDGSGAERWRGDLVIDGGRIVEVTPSADAPAREVLDADGMVVAPGFIDPHTHVDPQLWWDPFGLPLVLHGVTTVMTGNCAVTLAPCDPQNQDLLARLFYQVEEVPLDTLRQAVPWSWSSFGEYLDGLEGRLGINCASLVGHCAVRVAVMGEEALERSATPDEVDRMRELVRTSLRAGAIGFSTSQNKLHVGEGGVPIPSRWAELEEVVALCEVLGEEGRGVIQTDGGVDVAHRAEWVRTVGGPLAERTGRTVLAGNVLPAFGGSQEILDAIADVRARGGAIYAQAAPSRFDSYFTVDGGTITFNVFACWREIASMSHEERVQALADPAFRDRIQEESVDCERPARWDRIRISKTAVPHHQGLVGRTIAEIASERGERIVDVLAEIALEEDLQTQLVIEAPASVDDAIASFLRSPQAIIGGSDAGAHVKTFCGGGNTSLLLSKWVRDLGVLTLEDAVRQLTSVQAEALGLERRGLLAPGHAADVVVFDLDRVSFDAPRTVQDLPGGAERLWQDATGFDHVLVNGRFAVRDGELTDDLAGAVLRSGPSVD